MVTGCQILAPSEASPHERLATIDLVLQIFHFKIGNKKNASLLRRPNGRRQANLIGR
jgi:hypothetical protein